MPVGKGGMFGLVFDNTFSKQTSKNATFVPARARALGNRVSPGFNGLRRFRGVRVGWASASANVLTGPSHRSATAPASGRVGRPSAVARMSSDADADAGAPMYSSM